MATCGLPAVQDSWRLFLLADRTAFVSQVAQRGVLHMLRLFTFLALLAQLQCFANPAVADTFGSGGESFEVEFVPIGGSGNLPDTSGSPSPIGSVTYSYRMGKFEISEEMIRKANALGGLGITMNSRGPSKPATSISWFEAARFVNWLNASTGSSPAYKFDAAGNFELWESIDMGYDSKNRFRNRLARYFLPSADEWYKAAYFAPSIGDYYDYPTGSDSPPTAVASGTAVGSAVYSQSSAAGPADINLAGGSAAFGTVGQGGNVWEWQETETDLLNDSISSARGVRGGSWVSGSSALSASSWSGLNPGDVDINRGFRVATVGETSTPLPGDANGDDVVDRADLAILTSHYGMTDGASFADGDFNDDHRVSLADLLLLQKHFGESHFAAPAVTPVAALAAVPEPSTLAIALAGITYLVLQCRRTARRHAA